MTFTCKSRIYLFLLSKSVGSVRSLLGSYVVIKRGSSFCKWAKMYKNPLCIILNPSIVLLVTSSPYSSTVWICLKCALFGKPTLSLILLLACFEIFISYPFWFDTRSLGRGFTFFYFERGNKNKGWTSIVYRNLYPFIVNINEEIFGYNFKDYEGSR